MKVDIFFHPCSSCSLRETCYPLKASYHMVKVLKDNIERQMGAGVTANFEVTLKGCPNFHKKEEKKENARTRTADQIGSSNHI